MYQSLQSSGSMGVVLAGWSALTDGGLVNGNILNAARKLLSVGTIIKFYEQVRDYVICLFFPININACLFDACLLKILVKAFITDIPDVVFVVAAGEKVTFRRLWIIVHIAIISEIVVVYLLVTKFFTADEYLRQHPSWLPSNVGCVPQCHHRPRIKSSRFATFLSNRCVKQNHIMSYLAKSRILN